jgi:transcriptional regulator with XRE-family HTH domain
MKGAGPRPERSRGLKKRVLAVTNLDQDIDVHIGRRLRARRRLLGLSQPQLAEAVGVKFQQIQKYECGEDRIAASRLWSLCAALKAPVDYFYEGLESRRGETSGEIIDFDGPRDRREALDLACTYQKMGEQPRRMLLDLARSLSRRARSE